MESGPMTSVINRWLQIHFGPATSVMQKQSTQNGPMTSVLSYLRLARNVPFWLARYHP